jgi:hypothetical protein
MAAKHKVQHFNGRAYYRRCEGYYAAAFLSERKTRYMHRDVWEHYNGPIPDGYEVHHKDSDRAHNAIGNLELLSGAEHARLHMLERIAADPAGNRRALDAAREAAKAWHASDAGRQWHSEHATRVAAAQIPVDLVCSWCGETYLGHLCNSTKFFCSPSCQGMARKKSGVDDETRACATCGGEFRANRYGRTKTCSKDCWKAALSAAKRRVRANGG